MQTALDVIHSPPCVHPLFPYTTLYRSRGGHVPLLPGPEILLDDVDAGALGLVGRPAPCVPGLEGGDAAGPGLGRGAAGDVGVEVRGHLVAQDVLGVGVVASS